MVDEFRWAMKDIDIIVTATGCRVVVTTFHACHLWMRYTTVPPAEHMKPVIQRGVPVYADKRFCFVVYEDNEQEEAGDTYYHTFIKEPWAHCETRWFYFTGTVGQARSRSVSAIFVYHRYSPEYYLILEEPWTVDLDPPEMERLILEPWTDPFY